MTAQKMWEQFSQENEEYEAWSFGGDPDGLAQLVLSGVKTATASAYDLYVLTGESLPQVGQYSVILDSREEAVCIIQTTAVSVVPFRDVTHSHAWKEGEGDRSLADWRGIHEAFFRSELEQAGLSFRDDRMVVCEEFLRVYP